MPPACAQESSLPRAAEGACDVPLDAVKLFHTKGLREMPEPKEQKRR